VRGDVGRDRNDPDDILAGVAQQRLDGRESALGPVIAGDFFLEPGQRLASAENLAILFQAAMGALAQQQRNRMAHIVRGVPPAYCAWLALTKMQRPL
jgi:hypothetical protein